MPFHPTCFQQRECSPGRAAYKLTVRRCSDDMKNPDSTWQQLSTILAGLSHNHCGVWSLDKLWGWLETKRRKSSPAVQQGTLCWKCHGSKCPWPYFSRIAQKFKFHCWKLLEILLFPRPWKVAISHPIWLLGKMSINTQPHIPLSHRIISYPVRTGKLDMVHCPPHLQNVYNCSQKAKQLESKSSILYCLKCRHFALPPWFSWDRLISGLLQLNTTDWVAHIQQKFISHSSGSWKFKTRMAAWLGSGEGRLQGCRLPVVSSRGGREKGGLWRPCTTAVIPFLLHPP